MSNQERNIITLDFSNQNIPLPIESRNTSETTFVSWGLDNQYPAFLLDLYGKSAIHSAIINQKTNYIIGDGLKLNGKDALDLEVNASDSLREFSTKVVKDYLLFNAFAVEVCFNVMGQPIEFHHIPVQKIRLNKNKTKFFYSEDWYYKNRSVTYDRYSVKHNQDGTSKVFYFDGYFPSMNLVYPTPEYNGTIKSIRTDIDIKEFNLNNIQNHFSPSTIITFFNGANVTEAVKKEVIRDIDTNFRGQSGRKFIIDFQHKDGKSPEVKQISANDWDKAYLTIAENNVNDILIGHQVQNPSLFAIQVAGKLGNSQEYEVSYEIFKSNYISVKRQEIESALNQLFTNYEPINSRVEFSDKALFNTQLKDEIKLKIYTINELRTEAGLEPLPDGNRLLDDIKAASGTTPTQDVAPVQQQEDVKKKSSRVLSEEDYELISHLGVSFEDFEVEEINQKSYHFGKEADIAEYVIKNDIKGLTLPELVDVLKTEGKISTTQPELEKILKKLADSGVVNVTTKGGRIAITPNPEPNVPNTDAVSVMYRYIKRPEVSGTDLIPTSRSFCVKMIENNRLYTREDIQSMSAIFGYDVFTHCGGWYYNPVTDETTNYCRHQWQMVRVKKRNQ